MSKILEGFYAARRWLLADNLDPSKIKIIIECPDPGYEGHLKALLEHSMTREFVCCHLNTFSLNLEKLKFMGTSVEIRSRSQWFRG